MISTTKTKTKAREEEVTPPDPGPSRIPVYTGSSSDTRTSRHPTSAQQQSTSSANPSSATENPQSISTTMAPGSVLVDPSPVDQSTASAAQHSDQVAQIIELQEASTPQNTPSQSFSTDTSLFGSTTETDRQVRSETEGAWRRRMLPPSASTPIPRDTGRRFEHSTPVPQSSTNLNENSMNSNAFMSNQLRNVRIANSPESSMPRASVQRTSATPETYVQEQTSSPELGTTQSPVPANESFGEFYDRLRRMYVLQYARSRDLLQFSTTDVPEQRIVIDGNTFYSTEFPLVRMSTFDLTQEDWRYVRERYVEPFGPDDQIRGRQRPAKAYSSKSRGKRPVGPGDSDSEPSDSEDGNNGGDKPSNRPERRDESRKDKSGHKGNSGGAPPPPPPPGGNGPPDSDDDPDRTDSDEDIHPRSA
ncbi:hypothetical protein L218DRAFT_1007521, partial [Marasmius fiardii PR-910]